MKESVHIIGGTGKMGSWLEKFLGKHGAKPTISGRKLQVENIKNADILFISVPISKSSEVILEASKIASKSAVIIDLSSSMHNAHSAFLNILQPHMSLHFLFGPDTNDLRNQVIITTNKNHEKMKHILSLFEHEGARIIELDSTTHDTHMAVIQNLTHFINLAYFQTINTARHAELSTPTYLAQLSAVNKVLSLDPALISEIQTQNPIGKTIIKEFLNNASSLLEIVRSLDQKKLEKKITEIQKEFKNKRELVAGYTSSSVSSIKKTSQVAYLGPEHTYSHAAAKLTKSTKLIPASTIAHVFSMIENGSAEYGVVPAQNTIEGAVRETFDLLAFGTTHTIGSLYVPIHHCLASAEKDMTRVASIYSHPQALAQCSQFLATQLPHAAQIETRSTVSDIEQYKNQKGTGFVTSREAAKAHGLHVLVPDIGNNTSNTTRFFVISKSSKGLKNASKTLLFLSVYNRVGILKDILTVFANENINLSNIESRPSRDKSWDYHFFVEVDVAYNSTKLQETLTILKQYCPSIKILGALS